MIAVVYVISTEFFITMISVLFNSHSILYMYNIGSIYLLKFLEEKAVIIFLHFSKISAVQKKMRDT